MALSRGQYQQATDRPELRGQKPFVSVNWSAFILWYPIGVRNDLRLWRARARNCANLAALLAGSAGVDRNLPGKPVTEEEREPCRRQ